MSDVTVPSCAHAFLIEEAGNYVPGYGWESTPGTYCADCGEHFDEKKSATYFAREEALQKIRRERARQTEMYGDNAALTVGFGGIVSLPWLAPYSHDAPPLVCARFRAEYDAYEAKHGSPSWMHLIREEVAELFETDNLDDLIEEAIQVAALCVSLVELSLQEQGEKA